MHFQKVLKGINGLTIDQATKIAIETGIISNWWRAKGTIAETEIMEQLTEDNLMHHLNDYDVHLPLNHPLGGLGITYGDVTPFISTTSGSYIRENDANIFYDPFITALEFATDFYNSDGFIFYAYLMTIGKKSVPLRSFAEEVRDILIYNDYLPFHHEGEITAKISIPSINIEKVEYYDGSQSYNSIVNGNKPMPIKTIFNPNYKAAESYSNIREIL